MDTLSDTFISGFVTASVISICASSFQSSIYPFVKPVPILLLLICVVYGPQNILDPNDPNRPLNVSAFFGLVFGMIGDIIMSFYLDRGNNLYLFLASLVSFMSGHAFYIAGFSHVEWTVPTFITIPYYIICIAISGHVSKKLIASGVSGIVEFVITYSVVMAIMIGCAFNLDYTTSDSFPFCTVGAALFALSDLALVVNGFIAKFPFSDATILSTYYAAQFCIVTGLLYA